MIGDVNNILDDVKWGGEDNRVEIIEYEALVRSKPIQALEAQKQLAGIWEREYSSTLATWH